MGFFKKVLRLYDPVVNVGVLSKSLTFIKARGFLSSSRSCSITSSITSTYVKTCCEFFTQSFLQVDASASSHWASNNHLQGLHIMNLFRSFQSALGNSASYLQHLFMKVAVAASLKLCIFAARVLLGSSEPTRRQAGQF